MQVLCRGRSREFLIIAELALCVPLMIGAGLLVKSFVKLSNIDTGFQTDRVVTSLVILTNARYSQAASQILFFRDVVNEIQKLPSVESAGVTDGVPLSGNISGSYIVIDGHASTTQGDDRPSAEVFSVTPDYLSTVGIGLVRGRGFGGRRFNQWIACRRNQRHDGAEILARRRCDR